MMELSGASDTVCLQLNGERLLAAPAEGGTPGFSSTFAVVMNATKQLRQAVLRPFIGCSMFKVRGLIRKNIEFYYYYRCHLDGQISCGDGYEFQMPKRLP